MPDVFKTKEELEQELELLKLKIEELQIAQDQTHRLVVQQLETEEALRQSEERFRVMQQGSPDGFVILGAIRDEQGQLIDFSWEYINPVTEKNLNRKLEDLKGKCVRELYPSSRRSSLFDACVRVIATGLSQEIEIYYDSEGVRSWYRYVIVKAGNGVAITYIDITRHKQAEAQLRKSQEEYRLLTETMPQLVWRTKANGMSDYFSQRWYDYTGQTPEQAYGSGWQDVLHPDDLEATVLAWNKAVQGEQPYNIEYRLRHHAGMYGWFLARGVPVKDKAGRITAWFGTSTDIGEQKEAEEKLRFLSETSVLLASSLDYEVTLQSVTSLIISQLGDYCLFDLLEEDSQSFKRVAVAHRDPAKEILMRETLSFYSRDSSQPHLLTRILNSGQSELIPVVTDAVIESEGRGGEHLKLLYQLKPQSAMSVPLKIRGQVIGVLSFVAAESGHHYDTEDLLLAEEIARRAAVAIDNARLYQKVQKSLETQKELDHLKDLFMSVASHELRTPLTSIKGYAQMLQRNFLKQANNSNKTPAETSSENSAGIEQAKNLRSAQIILGQTERMNDLVDQLLDFSRIQNHKLELQYSEGADLVALVGRVVEQQRLAGSSHHTLLFQTPGQTIRASYDEARLEQVLDNLISNAFKYSPPDTTVTVGVEYSSPEVRPEEVIIWVRDQGIGISKEYQAHIFERFYRVRTQNNLKVEGLGLGLYVSYEIINQHGGRMWFKSEPGQGSTFYLALPLQICLTSQTRLTEGSLPSAGEIAQAQPG